MCDFPLLVLHTTNRWRCGNQKGFVLLFEFLDFDNFLGLDHFSGNQKVQTFFRPLRKSVKNAGREKLLAREMQGMKHGMTPRYTIQLVVSLRGRKLGFIFIFSIYRTSK